MARQGSRRSHRDTAGPWRKEEDIPPWIHSIPEQDNALLDTGNHDNRDTHPVLLLQEETPGDVQHAQGHPPVGWRWGWWCPRLL